MTDQQLTIRPNVTIEIVNVQTGEKRVERKRNLITSRGVQAVGQLILRGVAGTGSGWAPTHVALGSGTTAPTIGESTLVAENYRDWVTVRRGSGSGVNWTSTFQLFLDTDVGNGLDFKEAGLFDSTTVNGGQLFSRVIFTPISKTSSIQVAVTWDINITGN